MPRWNGRIRRVAADNGFPWGDIERISAMMNDQNSLQFNTVNVLGVTSDHGGHRLKKYLTSMLPEAGVEMIDFGDQELVPDDNYPSFAIPMARVVAAGQVDRGIAICGSGVGG